MKKLAEITDKDTEAGIELLVAIGALWKGPEDRMGRFKFHFTEEFVDMVGQDWTKITSDVKDIGALMAKTGITKVSSEKLAKMTVCEAIILVLVKLHHKKVGHGLDTSTLHILTNVVIGLAISNGVWGRTMEMTKEALRRTAAEAGGKKR